MKQRSLKADIWSLGFLVSYRTCPKACLPHTTSHRKKDSLFWRRITRRGKSQAPFAPPNQNAHRS
ncbi:MAG: hypothetical protein D6714_18610 [Bacteroidetes bacterium]|nr:MAG: hypothetical protein D6714_18610 [Bacteroidota bacterium]